MSDSRPLWREGTRKAIARVKEEQSVWRAQLAEMPWDTIEAWLLEQGWVIVSREWHRKMLFRAAPLPGDGDE